jgi:cephalosporin-C deacetylase
VIALPLIDMPLAELKTYRGTNPRPADFDAYWEESLRELAALDAEAVFEPAEFQAPGVRCYHLWYTGVRGARIHARFLRPAALSAPAPALCVFHGYSGCAPSFSRLLSYAGQGFVVAAMDCRGQGGQSQDTGGFKGNTLIGHVTRGLDDPDNKMMLFREIYLDAAQMAGIVLSLPYVDPLRVGALGGSQGGGLTLACAALEPRVCRAASQYPFLCDFKRVWDMDLDKAAYDDLRMFFRRHDPLHRREEELFTKLGYIDVSHLAPRIRARVLMATGLMDTICPPSTQFAAYNRITSQKDMAVYPDFGHEDLPEWDDMEFQFMLGMGKIG